MCSSHLSSTAGRWCAVPAATRTARRSALGLNNSAGSTGGRPQAYFFGSEDDGDAWLVAEAGTITRRYSSRQPGSSLGEPLPVERRWLAHHGLSAPPEQLRDDEAFPGWALDCCAPAVAADLSIDPVWSGWPDQVQVSGHPLIARTDAGRHQSALRDCHMMRI